jgi:Fe-S cluster assembly protein SufD
VPTAFVDLNGAFFEDRVTIRIAAGTIVAAPLHVLSIVVPESTPILVAPRLAIDAGEASQVTVIESYATVGAGTALVTAVTDITLQAGALLDHVKIQRESGAVFHLASTFVSLGRASTFTSQAITFGGRIARNDIVAVLDGEGAECTLNGLYLADGDAVVDTHTTIDHAKPHCPSHEVYKGVLGGRAKAVFNGKIIVRPDAQKTDAKQTNKALLLTDDAQVNTKPQLEIFADDVKCTHGAAIGQLDDDAMFYLRARGIPEFDARSLLIHAFAGQVLDGIKVDAVRKRVQQVMEEKLKLS